MAGGQALEGNPADAQNYFELAHEIAPEDPRVHWFMVAGSLGRENTAEAADVYRAGLKKNGDLRYEFAWRLAEILIESNPKSDEVASAFNGSSKRTPTSRFIASCVAGRIC